MRLRINVAGTKFARTGPNGIGVKIAFLLDKSVINDVVGEDHVIVRISDVNEDDLDKIRRLGVQATIV